MIARALQIFMSSFDYRTVLEIGILISGHLGFDPLAAESYSKLISVSNLQKLLLTKIAFGQA